MVSSRPLRFVPFHVELFVPICLMDEAIMLTRLEQVLKCLEDAGA